MDEVKKVEIKEAEEQKSWLIKYVQENPLTVIWFSLLGIGGVMLFSFHLGLGYLPDFQLSDLFGIFIGTTLTGALFLFFVMVFGLMPAYFLRLFDVKKTSSCLRGNTHDEEMRCPDRRGASDSSDKKKELTIPIERKLFPGGFDHIFLWLVPPILLGFVILVDIEIFPNNAIANSWIKRSVGFVFLLSVLFYFLESKKKLRVQTLVKKIFIEKILNLFLVKLVCKIWGVVYEGVIRKLAQLFDFLKIFGFAIWLMASVLPAYVAFLFAGAGLHQNRTLTFFLFVLFFGFFNALIYIAVNKERLIVISMVSALFACTMIPLMVNQPLLFPNVIVRLLSLGNVNATNLTLSYKQCLFLTPAGVTCPQNIEGDSQMSLQNVNILSKVGSSMLVEIIGARNLETKLVDEIDSSKFPMINFDQDFSNRLCRKNSDGAVSDACSSCDDIVLEKAIDSLRERFTSEMKASNNKSLTDVQTSANKKNVDEKLAKFAKSLVCYRVLIPKDQISNIGFAGSRAYSGFTRYILPEQKK